MGAWVGACISAAAPRGRGTVTVKPGCSEVVLGARPGTGEIEHSSRYLGVTRRWRGVGGDQTWVSYPHRGCYLRTYTRSSVVLCHPLDSDLLVTDDLQRNKSTVLLTCTIL